MTLSQQDFLARSAAIVIPPMSIVSVDELQGKEKNKFEREKIHIKIQNEYVLILHSRSCTC